MSDADQGSPAWPLELRVDARRGTLTVCFDTGEEFEMPAEYLRVESPSAEVQGHSAAQKQIVAGKRHVKIEALEPVGNYATRIRFDDGHDTGLYSWDYLYRLGRERKSRWTEYLSNLRRTGGVREP
ncbi:MAG: gamma-butyrobetaine hydroxylase-like domain-containing protein [Rhizomicrobium sp.]